MVHSRAKGTEYVPYRRAGSAIREWAEGRPCGDPAGAQMLADWLHGLANEIKQSKNRIQVLPGPPCGRCDGRGQWLTRWLHLPRWCRHCGGTGLT
jgi:hypothetical protein